MAAQIPILIEFTGSWCITSQAMKPLLSKLQKKYKKKVLIQVVNVDINPILRVKWDIQSCPTFILFMGDKEITRKVGALSSEQLEEMINHDI